MTSGGNIRPRVVCLCGSLRFDHLFQSERRRLTSQGVIVLAPEAISEELTPSRSEALSELHLRRIDLADEVRVVSEGGYVGSATRREIEYAQKLGKAVRSVETADFVSSNGYLDHEQAILVRVGHRPRRSHAFGLFRSNSESPAYRAAPNGILTNRRTDHAVI